MDARRPLTSPSASLRRTGRRAPRRARRRTVVTRYETYRSEGVPIRAWTKGVPVEDEALAQLRNVARLPVVHGWVAAMPDVHWGIGATVGSVIPTKGAIIPAAVGVDIGCGMMAVKTSLTAAQLPDDLKPVRRAIEQAVPHGRTDGGGRADRGSWDGSSRGGKGGGKGGGKSGRGARGSGGLPARVEDAWRRLRPGYEAIVERQPRLDRGKHVTQLGTLGTGNHFIEICVERADDSVWAMLHSGSRGVGNRIGMHFIKLAQKDMKKHLADLPDKDLAYLTEGAEHFDEYVAAVEWAQTYARVNRELMMTSVLEALREPGLPSFRADLLAVNCHHNYVTRETHGGEELLVTRKGAVRAGAGELGIIPGSMGARSYIVRGKGNPDSYESCSHGAGRAMSRREAKRRFTIEDHARATERVECRKDAGVLDETPGAYKSIDAVMAAQEDLVEVAHVLEQVVCVKG